MPDIEKYRRAGNIAQSGLAHVLKELHKDRGARSIGEICREADSFLRKLVDQSFKKVEEKGIALPVDISKADFVSGVSPESFDAFQGGIINDGDVVKVTLGVHLDGYAVMAGHTVVIRENPTEPWQGADADAVIAAYLASEAVLSALSIPLSDQHVLAQTGPVTGHRIRKIVDDIAQAYDAAVVPGSRVRRIQRFIAGQPSVHEKDAKAVEWFEDQGEPIDTSSADSFEVETGEAYIVDIAIASKNGAEGTIKVVEFNGVGSDIDKPSVYTRDQTAGYALKMPNARLLLSRADKESVFPFKLSYLSDTDEGVRKLRLGLNEVVQRRLLVPSPKLKARFVAPARKQGTAVNVAREVSTAILTAGDKSASGFPEFLRLSGGQQFPPSWVKSSFELQDGDAAQLLNARSANQPGIRYLEVTGKLQVGGPAEDDSMLID